MGLQLLPDQEQKRTVFKKTSQKSFFLASARLRDKSDPFNIWIQLYEIRISHFRLVSSWSSPGQSTWIHLTLPHPCPSQAGLVRPEFGMTSSQHNTWQPQARCSSWLRAAPLPSSWLKPWHDHYWRWFLLLGWAVALLFLWTACVWKWEKKLGCSRQWTEPASAWSKPSLSRGPLGTWRCCLMIGDIHKIRCLCPPLVLETFGKLANSSESDPTEPGGGVVLIKPSKVKSSAREFFDMIHEIH